MTPNIHCNTCACGRDFNVNKKWQPKSDNSALFSVKMKSKQVTMKLKSSAVTLILFVIIFVSIPVVHGTITVVSELSNETMMEINDAPATFVPERVPFYGIQGFLIAANPPDACSVLKPPPNPYPSVEFPINWILIARRQGCTFQTKIENAQNAGYSAIIIHNVDSNSTEPMHVEDASRIMIYACFIGEYDGLILKENFTYRSGYFIRIQDDFSIKGYLWPFGIVVGVCFIVMLLFMVRLLWQQVTRWIRERRRSRRRKLPASALKKLPTQKWTKGDPYETCAVCLDDFVEQDKIRVLPCAHGFHMVCIDPWLTKGRRVCPICKRKVVLADENFSDSGSDTDDESAPLIGTSTSTATQNPSSGNSTFVQPEETSFRRAQRRQRDRQQRGSSSMNQQLIDSDVSSTSSEGSSSGIQNRVHNSCPVLAEVHHIGRNHRQSSSYNPHHVEKRMDENNSHTYQTNPDSHSQTQSGEENAAYFPERDSEEDGSSRSTSDENSLSQLVVAGGQCAIEIVQPQNFPKVCIIDTFNNSTLESTVRPRPSRDPSPGTSEESGKSIDAIV